jgi:hypothetical protein
MLRYALQSAFSTPVGHFHLTSMPSVWCVYLYLCFHMCMRMLWVQPSTVHVELPGCLEPGTVPATLVAATVPAEGILTDTNPSREHEHCPPPRGECVLLSLLRDCCCCYRRHCCYCCICMRVYVCVRACPASLRCTTAIVLQCVKTV